MALGTKMGEFAFMKSGFSSLVNEGDGDLDVDFMRNVTSLLKLLASDAVVSADRFVNACGRRCITAEDMRMALRYD